MDAVPGRTLEADGSVLDATYCQPCYQADRETLTAEAYCSACKEFMCSTCTNVHRKQMVSKSHILLDRTSMPTTIIGFSTKEESTEPCDKHPGELIKYYCPTHQTLNCGHCLVLGKISCKQEIISEISQTFIDGQGLKEIKQGLAKLLDDIAACSSDVKEFITFVENLSISEISKLQEYREQVNKYFDEREQTILKTIDEIKNKDKTLLDSLKPRCANLETKVQEIKSKLEAQEHNTSNLFIEAQRVKKTLMELQSNMTEINNAKTIHQYSLRKDPVTERLLASKTGLGTIEETICCRGKQTLDNDNMTGLTFIQAHSISVKSPPDTDECRVTSILLSSNDNMTGKTPDIQVKSQSDTDDCSASSILPLSNDEMTGLKFTPAPDIPIKSPSDTGDCLLTSMLLLSGNRLLLADRTNNTVKIVDLNTSSLVSEVKVAVKPWDMCLLPGDRVAITSTVGSIQFLEKQGQFYLGNSIKLDENCRGIGYHNDSLIVSFSTGKVKKMNMDGKALKNVSKKWFSNQFQYPWCLTVVNEGQAAVFYVSDYAKHTITSLDIDLNILQTLENPALHGPTGITAVGNQLLVCGLYSNNIMCLHLPSGQMTKLLGKGDGIWKPYSVCYSQQQKKLYVTHHNKGINANNVVKVYTTR
ncbi:uncharacterized protein LOC128237956 [Mya arenaria]|uniref:uncharacterized protein LOC128237956 n=1 Tax=Mya arenaria TaxID=6604 RepID=UPI0022E13ED6|nr:uncharacterized protein LOC128237956 [Mya arenaria]